MDWFRQIDINFVMGLIAVIVGYIHNHSWRKQQAGGSVGGGTPSPAARLPGEVPIVPVAGGAARAGATCEVGVVALLALAVVIAWVSIVAGCSGSQKAAERRAVEVCAAEIAAQVAAKAAAAKQTGETAASIELSLLPEEIACIVSVFSASAGAGSGSSG